MSELRVNRNVVVQAERDDITKIIFGQSGDMVITFKNGVRSIYSYDFKGTVD